MLSVHTLPETGEAYLGSDEPGCGWASHLADPDAGARTTTISSTICDHAQSRREGERLARPRDTATPPRKTRSLRL